MQITLEELTVLITKSADVPTPYKINPANPLWKIGEKYFIRTVTHHHTGVLIYVDEHEIGLEQAAWIADDGRLTDSLKTGEFNEVEMFPSGPVGIGRGSIIDFVRITSIPISQK